MNDIDTASPPKKLPTPPFVAALTWVMKDSLGDELDVLDDPVEFVVGASDLLPCMNQALQAQPSAQLVGQTVQLYIEPEQGFGDFNEKLIFLIPRQALPDDFSKNVEVGMSLDGTTVQRLQADAPIEPLYTVTDIYPQHLVIDGNHPLAGISLDLKLNIHAVRQATNDELASGLMSFF